jgi:hypothetical protein
MATNKDEVSVKHTLSDKDLADLAREQARNLDRLDGLKKELEHTKKQYGATISEHEAAVQRVTAKIHSGFEHRNVMCLLLDHRPEGYRLVVRIDTAHIVKRRRLDEADHVGQLKLIEGAAPQAMCIATLAVDDESWEADFTEVLLYEDEWELLRHVEGLATRPVPLALTPPPQDAAPHRPPHEKPKAKRGHA